MDKKLKSQEEQIRLGKTVIVLVALAGALFIGIILVSVVDWWEWKDAGAAYETSLITNILGTTFIICMYIVLVAIITIVLYSILLKTLKTKDSDKKDKSTSVLLGAAKEYEPQIIDMLKSVAKPSSPKQHLNRAPTAQFLRALTELGYLDANVSGSNLKAWVENVTGYTDKDKDSGHFYSAYNNSTKEDSKVRKYMDQIEQIVNS